MTLRTGYRWALGGTTIATGAALMMPSTPVVPPTREPTPHAATNAPRPMPTDAVSRGVKADEATPTFHRADFSGGDVDPFAGLAPPPAPVAAAPEAVAPPPPPPPPPTTTYRWTGTMTGPDGAAVAFLERGSTMKAVAAGTVLDDGFVVEAVNPADIVLRHTATGHRVSLVLPPLSPSARP